MSTTFSARLNRLFDTVYPPGRGPHTCAEVVAALKAEGITTMSAPYLSQLRSGARTNPSKATMTALANFFRIQPDYFTDDDYYRTLDQELTWLATLRDEGARRIAMRAIRLSPAAREEIIRQADEWRRKEHLDD
jgi:ESX-1-secreted protein regulator